MLAVASARIKLAAKMSRYSRQPDMDLARSSDQRDGMTMSSVLFRPLGGARIYAQNMQRPGIPFVVIAMFTKNIAHHADRLKSSLEKVELNFVIWEVPAIHTSISAKGTNDIAFCKPNFIYSMLDEHNLPVLYVDADMIFRDVPLKPFELSKLNSHFACYNWLADADNDAYVPIPVRIDGALFTDRFYRFSHSVDMLDETQLIVSGASQYYSPDARPLLQTWLAAINSFPHAADDELLDFVYNFQLAKDRIGAHWWGKEYCRCRWWINTRPVIDHPEIPGGNPPRSLKPLIGRERYNPGSTQPRMARNGFPRDCIIDVKEKCLLRPNGRGGFTLHGRFGNDLWIDPGAPMG
jgi:hypothetical protein